ncbi:hypothetical protein ANO11243_074840 [Dothideomycetidae sp. 11243]|nr:hypothetical protein ANO11243_074840 [fungal sp. No.11243]
MAGAINNAKTSHNHQSAANDRSDSRHNIDVDQPRPSWTQQSGQKSHNGLKTNRASLFKQHSPTSPSVRPDTNHAVNNFQPKPAQHGQKHQNSEKRHKSSASSLSGVESPSSLPRDTAKPQPSTPAIPHAYSSAPVADIAPSSNGSKNAVRPTSGAAKPPLDHLKQTDHGSASPSIQTAKAPQMDTKQSAQSRPGVATGLPGAQQARPVPAPTPTDSDLKSTSVVPPSKAIPPRSIQSQQQRPDSTKLTSEADQTKQSPGLIYLGSVPISSSKGVMHRSPGSNVEPQQRALSNPVSHVKEAVLASIETSTTTNTSAPYDLKVDSSQPSRNVQSSTTKSRVMPQNLQQKTAHVSGSRDASPSQTPSVHSSQILYSKPDRLVQQQPTSMRPTQDIQQTRPASALISKTSVPANTSNSSANSPISTQPSRHGQDYNQSPFVGDGWRHEVNPIDGRVFIPRMQYTEAIPTVANVPRQDPANSAESRSKPQVFIADPAGTIRMSTDALPVHDKVNSANTVNGTPETANSKLPNLSEEALPSGRTNTGPESLAKTAPDPAVVFPKVPTSFEVPKPLAVDGPKTAQSGSTLRNGSSKGSIPTQVNRYSQIVNGTSKPVREKSNPENDIHDPSSRHSTPQKPQSTSTYAAVSRETAVASKQPSSRLSSPRNDQSRPHDTAVTKNGDSQPRAVKVSSFYSVRDEAQKAKPKSTIDVTVHRSAYPTTATASAGISNTSERTKSSDFQRFTPTSTVTPPTFHSPESQIRPADNPNLQLRTPTASSSSTSARSKHVKLAIKSAKEFLDAVEDAQGLGEVQAIFKDHLDIIMAAEPKKTNLGRAIELTLDKCLTESVDEHSYLVQMNLLKSRTARVVDSEGSCSHKTLTRPRTDGLRAWCPNGMAGLRTRSPFASMTARQTPCRGSARPGHASFCNEHLDASGRKIAKGQPDCSEIQATTWTDGSLRLPSYTHCSYVSKNVAAPNQKVMHVYPYFGEEVEDKAYETLHCFYDMDIDSRSRKVYQCQKSRWLSPYVKDFLEALGCDESAILWYLLSPSVDSKQDKQVDREKSCHEDFDRDAKRWKDVLATLPSRAKTALPLVEWICEVFLRKTKLSLWHVVRKSQYASLEKSDEEQDVQDKSTSNQIRDISDLTCRVCHEHDCPYHKDYVEEIESEHEIPESTSVEDTDIDWPRSLNIERKVVTKLPSGEQEVRDTEDEIFVGPPPSRDKMAYPKLLQSVREKSHNSNKRFYPCNHQGSCADAKCRCFKDGVLCEKACGCSSKCERRFLGCSCHVQRKNGLCFKDDRCECFRLQRECDADLCKSCRADAVLDPVNRNDEAIQEACCRNVHMQLSQPKRTLLGSSNIHGFGIYSGEAIKKGEYVGEYRGELATTQEWMRRGEIYSVQKMSYLFTVTEDQEVDSLYAGNKMRFVNHATVTGPKGACNLDIFIKLCNMTPRIGMYASRDIATGEELFFNYGDGYRGLLETAISSEKVKPGTATKGSGKRKKDSAQSSNSKVDLTQSFAEPEYEEVGSEGNRHLSKMVTPRFEKHKTNATKRTSNDGLPPTPSGKGGTARKTAHGTSSVSSRSRNGTRDEDAEEASVRSRSPLGGDDSGEDEDVNGLFAGGEDEEEQDKGSRRRRHRSDDDSDFELADAEARPRQKAPKKRRRYTVDDDSDEAPGSASKKAGFVGRGKRRKVR